MPLLFSVLVERRPTPRLPMTADAVGLRPLGQGEEFFPYPPRQLHRLRVCFRDGHSRSFGVRRVIVVRRRTRPILRFDVFGPVSQSPGQLPCLAEKIEDERALRCLLRSLVQRGQYRAQSRLGRSRSVRVTFDFWEGLVRSCGPCLTSEFNNLPRYMFE